MSLLRSSVVHHLFLSLLISFAAASAPAQPNSTNWQLDAGASELTVHVFKAGLFSGFLHDHLFVPGQWNAIAQFDPARRESFQAEVSIVVGSLRDRQSKLSAEDRAKVESQLVGPEVLDAKRFPEIRFAAEHFLTSAQNLDELDGMVMGKLSLHGVTRTLEVPVRVWRRGDEQIVLGKVSFNQSDFSITPFHKAGGAIAVENRVLVDFALRFHSAGSKR